MHRDAIVPALTRQAQLSTLAASVRRLSVLATPPTAFLCAVVAAILWYWEHPGTAAFAMIGGGSLLILRMWQESGIGLPILPVLAAQNLLAYALPIAVDNTSIAQYPAAALTEAGVEILVFSIVLTGCWKMGMHLISASGPHCYALQGLADTKTDRLSRIALWLIAASTLYAVSRSTGWLWVLLSGLPEGSHSIISALTSAMSACGFFLGAIILTSNETTRMQRFAYWLALAINCYLGAMSLLLSAIATLVFSVCIGLFWGTGRLPWRFVVAVTVVLSFLNLGKFEMRARYWENDEEMKPVTLLDSPRYYSEWVTASYEALVGVESEARASMTRLQNTGPDQKSGQSMLERINNLQNLLFVIRAMDARHPPLGGATYALIPPLLLPRILWPDKPRSHQGQVMLNVHFGRQELHATFQTYIAWGLLPEAYGNFGPVTGAAILGAALGLMAAWIEKLTTNKLLLSLEGFLAFITFIGIANSFEMVASVLVTSLFQACVPVILACLPFVQYTSGRAPRR